MSKRLQVVLSEPELRRFRRAAQKSQLTLSEWARQVMRRAEAESATGNSLAKLAAIRTAAEHDFPTSDISQMLEEIEQSYPGDLPG